MTESGATSSIDFFDLAPVGDSSPHSPFVPTRDTDGGMRLEDYESPWVSITTPVVYSLDVGPHWQAVSPMKSPAQIEITNRRFILSWPDWKKDRGFGSAIERRLYATVMEGNVLCSHLRFTWITELQVTLPEKRSQQELLLFLNVDSQPVRVRLANFQESVLPVWELAARIACTRTSDDSKLDLRDRRMLDALARGQSKGVFGPWGLRYRFPGAVDSLQGQS